MGYVRRHWRGELSLAASFWVSFVLVGVVIRLIYSLITHLELIKHPVTAARFTLGYDAFALLVVYPWQIVGLWRACMRRIKTRGKRFWPHTVQVLVVLGLLTTMANLSRLGPVYRLNFQLAFGEDEFGDYALNLVKDDTVIHLQGGLGFGISDDVAELLKEHPDVEGIILDSRGGRLHEGRELARLISEYGLDTYSLQGCYSAATIAFLAGENRFLGLGANLAFHQYTMGDENLDSIFVQGEQAKDLAFFQKQGIKSEFLSRLFDTSHTDLWYPTVDEMLDAGVIHGIVKPSDLLPAKYDGSFEDVDDALLDIHLYKVIQQYHPGIYRQIKVELEKQFNKGATQIELQRAGADIFAPLFTTAMPKTSDEALIRFAQTIVDLLKKFKEIDPILGMKMLYPEQYGSVPFSEYVSDDESTLLGAMTLVIIDAYEKVNPVVDQEAAEFVLEKLPSKLEEYADYLELDGLQNTDDYGRHCEAVIRLYGLVLAEDKATAANTLRYMFTEQ